MSVCVCVRAYVRMHAHVYLFLQVHACNKETERASAVEC